VFEDDAHRREQAFARAATHLGQDSRRRSFAARMEPHRDEQRLPRGVGGDTALAAGSAVGRDDAHAFRELSQSRPLGHP
ncbi:MAG: hypothetical protein ACYSUM_24625, partial [Planctomycetota bacterium]